MEDFTIGWKTQKLLSHYNVMKNYPALGKGKNICFGSTIPKLTENAKKNYIYAMSEYSSEAAGLMSGKSIA